MTQSAETGAINQCRISAVSFFVLYAFGRRIFGDKNKQTAENNADVDGMAAILTVIAVF